MAGVYNNKLNMLDSSNTTPVVSLGEEMAYTCHQPNSITLDTCEYALGDDEAYTEPLPVLDLHQQLQRQGETVKVRQRFHFRVAEGADIRQMTNLQLVVEDAENFRYILNGRPYNFVDTGFWRDVCMRTSSIDGLVQTAITYWSWRPPTIRPSMPTSGENSCPTSWKAFTSSAILA